MTTNDLAAGSHRKCEDRLAALGQARLATACLGRLLGRPSGR
ncbi:MAG: hypothetical protein ACKOWG_15185 [Planctomycetia bacterium]